MSGDEGAYVIVEKKRMAGWCALFWNPNKAGRTTDFDKAGRYSKAEIEAMGKIEDYDLLALPVEFVERIVIRTCDRDSLLDTIRMAELGKGQG